MMTFLWSQGHIGWPLFAIVVLSAVYLIVADVIWRTSRIRRHWFALAAGVAWLAGVATITVLSVD